MAYNTGNPVGSTDPRDLSDNAENIDKAVNSEASSFTDRLGRPRLTWQGVIESGTGDPSVAVEAAAAALESAGRAESAAENVSEQAESIATQAAESAVASVVVAVEGALDRAEYAADRSEAARDAAFVNAQVYATVALGLAATVEGGQFQVVEGVELVRYAKQSGSAVEVARLVAQSVLATNRRIKEFPQRDYFVSGEIRGALISTTDTPINTPTWTISSANLVVNADVVGSTYRYFDTGEYWAGTSQLNAYVECVFTENLDNSGPSIQIGTGGDASSVRYLYARAGVIGAFSTGGAVDTGRGGAITVPSMAFQNGDVVGLRVVINPDGNGYVEASGPNGSHRLEIVSDVRSGKVLPAARRAAAMRVTKFSVGVQDAFAQEMAQEIADLERRVSDLESGSESASEEIPTDFSLRVTSLNHALFYGQSNCIGATVAGGTVAISLTQPYQNKSFQGGPRAWDSQSASWSYTPLKPLVEDNDTSGGSGDSSVPLGETQCSGAANYAVTLAAIRGVDPAALVMLASTAGRGSYRIGQLQKGSVWYPNLVAQVQAGKDAAVDYVCHYAGWVQGERDADVGTSYADYLALLEDLQSDIETDVKEVSGQSEPVPLLVSQVTAYSIKNDMTARAQIDAAIRNNRIFVVATSYRFPYGGNIHFTNVGAKLNGAYFGRAHDALLRGVEPDCIIPVSATLDGVNLRVRFRVPHLPMVLDRQLLAATQDYGFRVTAGGVAQVISGVEVSGPDVLIRLAGTPSGAVQVRYALDYTGAGRSVSEGQEGCGNLRDSAPESVTIEGQPYQLFNACPAFSMSVVRTGF